MEKNLETEEIPSIVSGKLVSDADCVCDVPEISAQSVAYQSKVETRMVSKSFDLQSSNLMKVVAALLSEQFVLLDKNRVSFLYCKSIDIFLLNPCNGGLQRTDNAQCFVPRGMETYEWNNPPKALFESKLFPFAEIRRFLSLYGFVDESMMNTDRYFWGNPRSLYNILDNNRSWNNSSNPNTYSWPTFTLKWNRDSVENWLLLLFENGFNLSCIKDENLRSSFLLKYREQGITSKIVKAALEEYHMLQRLFATFKFDFTSSDVWQQVNEKLVQQDLLECDKIRADIEPYDEKTLVDPNRGHWELWNSKDLYKTLMARNPCQDVRENGVVGIDFGTKSTVVVYQSGDERIIPMRVGTGDLKKAVSREQFENPTVIELISYDDFRIAYARGWRPNTRWCDLKVSHQANVDFYNSVTDGSYAAFFSDLKQWAGSTSRKRKYNLRDKGGRLVRLASYADLLDGDFDPIEIYAYYLGLYINNMRNGIFLEYYMSFPVAFEQDVKERIVKSFERGLKKSLPAAVVENEELMSRFHVNGNTDEPVAYAVCAMQEYGFLPTESKMFHYGVFDFGGGTTDFDFGEWSLPQKRKYDFKITHFGAQGDPTLGGERLLEYLSFEIFKKNADLLLEKGITFSLPPHCREFPGSEMLISNSCEAGFNTKRLMMALRPIWEGTETEDSAKVLDESSKIVISLLRSDGNVEPSVELTVTREMVMNILRDRIASGIRQFFIAFESAFKDRMDGVSKVHILLAGNSSKSPLITELFNAKILEYEEKNNKKGFFELLPPIGSEEFYEAKKRICPEYSREGDDRLEMERPTGKTGVAFGLIQARKGGRIEVENLNIVNGEIPFKYFVGSQVRGIFKNVVAGAQSTKNMGRMDVGTWYEFTDVEKGDTVVEVFFTGLPEATWNSMPISKTQKVRCIFPEVTEDALFFVRAVDPHSIEYAVAKSCGELEHAHAFKISLED